MSKTLEQMGTEGLAALRELLAAGEFHHATYRDQGTIWEGLWIYKRDVSGIRGFSPAGAIPGRVGREFCGGTKETNRSALDEAYALIRAHDGGGGVSVGSYGNG